MTNAYPSTREELLSSFARANALLDELSAKTAQDNALRSEIIREVPGTLPLPEKKPWKGMKRTLIALLIGFVCSITILDPLTRAIWVLLLQMVDVVSASFGLLPEEMSAQEFSMTARTIANVFLFIVVAAMTLITGFLVRLIANKIIAAMNVKIAKENDKSQTLIEAANIKNAETVAKLDSLGEEMNGITQTWADEIAPWYPVNYASPSACRFMYEAIQNYRADSIKEAVNLYETHMHQMRMEAQQEEQTRQAQMSTQLQMSLNERMEENNRLMKISTIANIATAASSAMTAANARSIASNTARTAANSGEAARQAKRAADAASAPRKVNVTVNRR